MNIQDDKKLLKKRIQKKKRKKQRKKIITLFLLALIVFLGITAYGILLAPNDCKLVVNKTVEIPKNSSITEIADILEKEHVISNKYAFIARVVISGNKSNLKHDKFVFSPDSDYKDIIKTLCEQGAKKETVTIVIPEGFSVEMIIKRCTDAGIGTKEDFEKALNKDYDYEFIKHINSSPESKYKLQGFLFPATYEFFTDATAEDVIDQMLGKFLEEYNKTGASYDNLITVITKASLIEREAKLDSERSTIAGVIENRLNTDMLLQIDASVVYAMTDGMYDIDRVYEKDYQFDSLYNTYKNTGLPVGPICNPGLKSIEAALNPEQHDYLYYCTTAANDGSHYFSRTYEEHLQYIALKKQTQQ